MQLTRNNVIIEKHDDQFTVKIMMPNFSRNYLHCEKMSLEDAVVVRDTITEQSIDHMNLSIQESEKYFRLILKLEIGGKEIVFHSRKLNVIDAVFERDLLLEYE